MAPEADAGGEGDEQWRYSIYLVGFPASAGDSNTEAKVTLVTDIIQHLIPEARVFAPHGSRGYAALNLPDLSTEDDGGPVENVREVAIEETEPPSTEDKDTIGDSSSVTSLAVYQFSPEWIEEEALILLKTIHENALTGGTAHRGKLLLAGYGFGGIVVKQAVIVANTNPNYYDVALNLSNLVFFATPHHSTNQLAWEEILLDLIKATEPSYSGWLISTLQTLVDTVAQLSHVFYRFAAKHSTTNIIEGKGLGSSAPVVGKLGEFDNDFEEVVQ